jgi:D-alanyl-D-alanine carboxypeptidase/D-alanyl-D-alanine-endopeptidase (penicillin-binding protein 4)
MAEVSLRAGKPLRQDGKLVALVIHTGCKLVPDLADPALDAPMLGLECERARVTGGQCLVVLGAGRRVLTAARRLEQPVDLRKQALQLVFHVSSPHYRAVPRRRAWAERTILRSDPAHPSGDCLRRARAVPTIPAVRGPRFLLAALLAALATAGTAGGTGKPDTVQALSSRLARALPAPGVLPSQTAALAVDLVSGATLFTRNADLPLEPASNEKLAVTFAALSTLGPDFRIRTDVVGRGFRSRATWHGDLYLVGHGDPALSGDALHELALAVKAVGIRRVTGSVIGDESFFDAERTVGGWKRSFYLIESAPLSALVVDGALYRGRISEVPALAAASRFRAFLGGVNVRVAGRSRTASTLPAGAVLLTTHLSPTLAEIVRAMDLESDNFTAELLLKQLGATVVTPATSAAGAAVVIRDLSEAGVPLGGVRIVDGSGLSRLDRMTVSALVGILHAAWSDAALRPLVIRALPLAGHSGTLRHRMLGGPARGRVRAKTGTTNEASALAGYVRRRYAFAILQNGRPIPSWWASQAQDRFAQVLAAQQG